MKRLISLLTLIALVGVTAMAQIGITKVGDNIKFTGLGLRNGIIPSSKAYSEIYSAGVDQVMVQGTNVIFINSAAKEVVATVPWARITNKLSTTEPADYVEELIRQGYLDKSGIKYAEDTLYIGTNRTTTTYFPDTIGYSMDGFKNLAISGYITEGHAVNDSLRLQVTNDYGTNWTTVYGYNGYTNTTVNQLKQTGAGTLSVTWSFPDLNYKYWRVVGGFGDATNIVHLRYRKTN